MVEQHRHVRSHLGVFPKNAICNRLSGAEAAERQRVSTIAALVAIDGCVNNYGRAPPHCCPRPRGRVADLDIGRTVGAGTGNSFTVQRNDRGYYARRVRNQQGCSRKGWPLSAADAISTAVDRRDGITVLTVDGVVDLATSPPLEELLGQLVAEGPAALILDLTTVSFLASVGLRILAETHESLGGVGKFAVVASGPATARPIQLTKLDDFLVLYPTVNDAFAGLRAR